MQITKTNINDIIDEIFNNNVIAGWYTDPKTGERIVRNVPEMMMLMVSEISEAMEGYRKKLQDDKMPEVSMVAAEMGDVFIRWADLCGYLKSLNYPDMDQMDEVIEKKRHYNANRSDHKLENRKNDPNGKDF